MIYYVFTGLSENIHSHQAVLSGKGFFIDFHFITARHISVRLTVCGCSVFHYNIEHNASVVIDIS